MSDELFDANDRVNTGYLESIEIICYEQPIVNDLALLRSASCAMQGHTCQRIGTNDVHTLFTVREGNPIRFTVRDEYVAIRNSDRI